MCFLMARTDPEMCVSLFAPPHQVSISKTNTHTYNNRQFIGAATHIKLLDFVTQGGQPARGSGRRATRASVMTAEHAAEAAAAAIGASPAIDSVRARPEALAAYVYKPFDSSSATVMQMPMRPAHVTGGMLQATDGARGFGTFGDTTPTHAPPALNEVEQLVDAIERSAGPLLTGLRPLTYVVNRTPVNQGGHGAHHDPSAYRGALVSEGVRVMDANRHTRALT